MKTCDNIRIHPHTVVTWDALHVGEYCPLCDVTTVIGTDDVKEAKVQLSEARKYIRAVRDYTDKMKEAVRSVEQASEEVDEAAVLASDAIAETENVLG